MTEAQQPGIVFAAVNHAGTVESPVLPLRVAHKGFFVYPPENEVPAVTQVGQGSSHPESKLVVEAVVLGIPGAQGEQAVDGFLIEVVLVAPPAVEPAKGMAGPTAHGFARLLLEFGLFQFRIAAILQPGSVSRLLGLVLGLIVFAERVLGFVQRSPLGGFGFLFWVMLDVARPRGHAVAQPRE
jgi:hypothetical protein